MLARAHDLSTDAEFILLGGLIYDNRRIDTVADIVAPEDFAEQFFGEMFGLIVSEYSQGRAANPITLRPLLASHRDFERFGGNHMLAELGVSESMAFPPAQTARYVRDLARRRRLVAGLTDSLGFAADGINSLEAAVEKVETALSEVAVDGGKTRQPTASEAIDEYFRSYDEPMTGVLSRRVPSIDRLLGPLRPKSLTLGGGRPGMGKTAAALSYSIGAALEGHGVLFVSLEMGANELAERMIADLCFDGHAGVPYKSIRDRKLTADQWVQVKAARKHIAAAPFQIYDKGSLTVGALARKVRFYKRRFEAAGHKLELVVVDYIQLVRPDQRCNSNYEAVSEVSRALKAMAKDEEVAVFALAQLSREVDKRPDKRPILSDMRDSGQLEQDADAVLFFYRHEYYLRQIEPDQCDPKHADWQASMRQCQNRIDFIAAKVRHDTAGSQTGEFWAGNQAVRG